MLSYFLLFLNNIKYTFKEEKSLKIIEEIRITLLGFIFCMIHVNANEKKTKKYCENIGFSNKLSHICDNFLYSVCEITCCPVTQGL